jgi:anaerobic ribonucleoside-triphosphate reductase activating protein
MKFIDTAITFSEIPDEITLCINISNCPNNCPGCQSSYLTKDIGIILNTSELSRLIRENQGISCVCLMGGDSDPDYINFLAKHIKDNFKLKTAWYSGKNELSSEIQLCNFDYIKIGSYIKELGPLTDKNTNQRLYMIISDEMIDITHKFWKWI